MIEFELIDDSQIIDVNLIDDTEKIEVGLIKEIDRYSDLKELPSINDVTLIGNKTLHDLGIQPEGDYVEKVEGKGLSTNDYTNEEKQKLSVLENYDDTEVRELIDTKQPRGNYLIEETDPTVPSHVKSITQEDINNWNNPSFTGDYEELSNLPKVNNITLKGNKTLSDLGIQPAGNYLTTETDPTVPNYVKNITQNDINNWNNKADESDIPDVSDFITKDVDNLTYYELKTNTGSLIDLEINDSTYVVTLKLKNSNGTTISTDTIDLPLESVVVGGSYDSETKEVVLSLEGGSEVRFSVADLVSGLQSEITSTNKLESDLVDDSNSGNKFVTSSQKTSWNAKYDKPNGGIPKTDLSSDVQTSLGKADTAIQSHQDLTDYVKNTDYANSTTGGVIKPSTIIGTGVSGVGVLYASNSSYNTYNSASDNYFIGKGTLENVITGKGLATKNDIPKYYHGTCATGASTRLKVVECEGFVLEEGATISVTFTNAQTYNGSPQLNVNGTGNVVVLYKGGSAGIRYMWSAGEIIDFTYNGEYWVCHGRALATTTYYGLAKLSSSAISTSTALALTPSALNATMENIVTGYDVYSTSATYEVGDRVRYSTHVYECIEAIPVKEAWTAGHWQIVDPLQTQIDALEARIKALENS